VKFEHKHVSDIKCARALEGMNTLHKFVIVKAKRNVYKITILRIIKFS